MYSAKGFTHHHRCKREEKGNVKEMNFVKKTALRTGVKRITGQKGKRESMTENSLHGRDSISLMVLS